MFKAKSQRIDNLQTGQELLEENNYLSEELDTPAEVAAFYGFMPVKTFQVTKEDRANASCFSDHLSDKRSSSKNGKQRKNQSPSKNRKLDGLFLTPEEKASIWRMYKDYRLENVPHPVMLYFKKPKKKTREISGHRRGLAIIGSEAGMAEVLMIKTSLAVLSDHGIKNTRVEINCAGDKDSVCRFEKELSLYYKKNADSLPEEWREEFKNDVWKILRCRDEKCREFVENAPQSISSLTPPSIQHFKEILEYLEILGIPYKINNCLVGNKNYCPQTLFEIREMKDSSGVDEADQSEENRGELRAIGYRHNYFSKKIGLKKDIPAIVTDIVLSKSPTKKKSKRQQRPKFYFIQIGTEAKIKSLNAIENLRKAGIRLSHSLTKDKLACQMDTAVNLKVSYLVMMGHKEAMENTVIVRDTETRFQETVPVEELAKYLKKVKSGS